MVALLASYWYFSIHESPIEALKIDQPKNGEELALGESNSWMLEGTIRLADQTQTTASTPSLAVEVFKPPERQAEI